MIDLQPDAALLAVDVQRGFADPSWGPRDNPDFEANLDLLLSAWTRTGRPVVVVRHDSSNPASPLHPDAAGTALVDAVAAVEPALLVAKRVNSAFYGEPDLRTWLEGRGVRQVVVAGIQTNMCCETTARMAGNLGYDVLFALDATHTFDLAGPDGVALTAGELARATAVNLHGGGFARVVGTADLVAAADATVAAS